MTCILVRRMCRNRLVDVGGRALTLGLFFFLMKCVKRADAMDVPGGCAIKKGLPSPSDPPGPRPLPIVNYHRKSSVSKVFNTLVMALVYGNEVMSKLIRACMSYYRRHCGPALSYPTAPSAPCTPSPPDTLNIPVGQIRLCRR